MNKLVKELDKVQDKRKKFSSEDGIVEDVQQFLLEAHKEENKVLESLGLDHQIKYSNKLQQDVTRTKLAQKRYDKKVYTGSEIKELCNKYDLRILPSKEYNGSIPVDLSRKVTEFCEANDMIVSSSNCFYILAPVEQFNTIKHVPIQADPILFYKDGGSDGNSSRERGVNENDKLVSIHYWGNDFSSLRKFRWLFDGYIASNDAISNFLRTKLALVPFVALLLFEIFSNGGMTFLAVPILACIVSFIFLYVNVNYKKNNLNELWNTNKR